MIFNCCSGLASPQSKSTFRYLLVACGLYLSGCSAGAVLGPETQLPELSKRVTQFNQAMHWGDAALAATFVVPEKRAELSRQIDDNRERERYMSFDVRSVTFDQPTEQGKVEVRIKYYRNQAPVVQTRNERQSWVYNEMNGKWMFKSSEIL